MGTADIKYGDSVVYVQHMKTGLWLSYQTFETKKRGVGRVEEKKVRNQLTCILYVGILYIIKISFILSHLFANSLYC